MFQLMNFCLKIYSADHYINRPLSTIDLSHSMIQYYQNSDYPWSQFDEILTGDWIKEELYKHYITINPFKILYNSISLIDETFDSRHSYFNNSYYSLVLSYNPLLYYHLFIQHEVKLKETELILKDSILYHAGLFWCRMNNLSATDTLWNSIGLLVLTNYLGKDLLMSKFSEFTKLGKLSQSVILMGLRNISSKMITSNIKNSTKANMLYSLSTRVNLNDNGIDKLKHNFIYYLLLKTHPFVEEYIKVWSNVLERSTACEII